MRSLVTKEVAEERMKKIGRVSWKIIEWNGTNKPVTIRCTTCGGERTYNTGNSVYNSENKYFKFRNCYKCYQIWNRKVIICKNQLVEEKLIELISSIKIGDLIQASKLYTQYYYSRNDFQKYILSRICRFELVKINNPENKSSSMVNYYRILEVFNEVIRPEESEEFKVSIDLINKKFIDCNLKPIPYNAFEEEKIDESILLINYGNIASF